MSSNTKVHSQRRASRSRGGQRSRSRNRGPRGSAAPPPKKQGLWQKILGFFGDSPAPSAEKPATDENDDSREPRERKRPESRPERKAPSRKPEHVEVTSPRLYVGNLSFDATESDLTELFNGVGLVQSVEIVFNRHTHRSKGFGFVQMQTIDEALRAVSELHDKPYMGRKLVVSGAKATDEKRSERSESQPEQ